MRLEHEFTIPVDIEKAWSLLLDIERVAPCLPGASVDTVEGDSFTGSVKVRLGPIGLLYRGEAEFLERDAAEHRAIMRAQGKDSRGNGSADATVTTLLTNQGGQTQVNVVTDLDITGKPAQFGRGILVDVSNKLLGQFVDRLKAMLAEEDAPEPVAPTQGAVTGAPAGVRTVSGPAVASSSGAAGAATPSAPAENENAVNLMDFAPLVAKRAAPALGAVIAAICLLLVGRRWGRRS